MNQYEPLYDKSASSFQAPNENLKIDVDEIFDEMSSGR